MDDATLTAATSTYRLLRLRPAPGSEMPDNLDRPTSPGSGSFSVR